MIDIGGNKPSPSTSNDNGGRSDLLAAIRASGGASGAGLKKASERKISTVNNPEPSESSSSSSQSAGGGLDLMGEISRKLAMRRKGMSGKADQDGGMTNRNVPNNPAVPKPSGAMDKISSMIPPPPPTTHQKNDDSDDDDDDW